MGTFLNASGITGVSRGEVDTALERLVTSDSFKNHVDWDSLAYAELSGNTTVLYVGLPEPPDEISQALSSDLQKTVFSFHLHDDDLWTFVMFANGTELTRFNPWPDYWTRISDAESRRWAGDPGVVATALGGIDVSSIERYFIRWTDDVLKTRSLAYPDDRAGAGDGWQLLDFMSRCGFSLPDVVEPETYAPVLTPEVQRQVQLREEARIRAAADEAWKERNYSEVIRLLSLLGDDLTASETKKREICQRKMSE